MGTHLFPWEEDVLGRWCSRDALDKPSFTTCGLSAPRQNGKNAVLEAFEFHLLVVCGAHILHTAHRVKTAKKSFQRLVRYFTDRRHKKVCAMVANIRYTNGEEAITLTNGASIEFSARSRAGARGFDDIQVVVFDEAQDLTDDQLAAIMFTLAASASGYRQMVFAGTPPDPGSPGEVFARTRASALSGQAKRTCWHEWSVEALPPKGAAFEDVLDDVYRTNPSMGYTLDEEFTESEFQKADMDTFARERLGWWSTQSAACAIPEAVWAGCAVPRGEMPKAGKKAFGVKLAPDGSAVALAACRMPEEGPAALELLGVAPLDAGLGWLEAFLLDEGVTETTAAVAVDGRNGAAPLMEMLAAAYPRQALLVPGTRGVVDSCSLLERALLDGQAVHPAPEASGARGPLDESALSCVKRQVGRDGGWAYGGEGSAPVEAAALALWACKTTKRDPEGGCLVL